MKIEELVRRLRYAAKFTLGESYYGQAADKLEELAAALAAKDAELAEVRQQYVDANEARIDAEAQLAERAGVVNEDALRALAQSYDREDAAQRGEPDPWNLDDPGDIGDSDTWVSERLACARAAAEAFLAAIEPAEPARDVEPVHPTPSEERLREALERLLNHYVELVLSGDAGFWDPEKEDEVIAARAALKEASDD